MQSLWVGKIMQSLSTATTLYVAQYAGNPYAAIYGPCANEMFLVAIVFLVIIGLLILCDIL